MSCQTPRHDPPQDMLADMAAAVWGQPRPTAAQEVSAMWKAARAEMTRERMDERAYEERVGLCA